MMATIYPAIPILERTFVLVFFGFFIGVMEDEVLVMEMIVLAILVAINAFFAASEIALISLNDNKIKVLADEGNKKARQLAALLGEPSRFLATIQIGITLAGFLASAFAAESFADPIVAALAQLDPPVAEPVLKVSTVVVITIILSYFTLVLGELVPKRIAMKKAESIAFFVAKPLTLLSAATSPFVKLLTVSTNFFIKLLGIDPHSIEDDVTEEEIRIMVDVGEEKGAINEHEKIMINNIFEFNNKKVEDIMTHRMEVVGVPKTIELKNLVALISEEQYSRIPVYENNIDNIIGIVYSKDLIQLINEVEPIEFDIKSYMRKPFFVPTHKKLDELFMELQAHKTHIGVVIDDYGGTAGIITIEDLIEEIVGNIFDEYDEEDLELKRLDDWTYEVSGMISLDELEEPFGLDLPKNDFDTFNGFLIYLFGGVPRSEEICEINYKNLKIRVTHVTEKRIEKAIVHIERQDYA